MGVFSNLVSVVTASGFSDYEGKYVGTHGHLISSEEMGNISITLAGLIKAPATVAKGTTVASFNSDLAPEGQRTFVVVTNGGFARLDVQADGKIVTADANVSGFVSLDGINFNISIDQ